MLLTVNNLNFCLVSKAAKLHIMYKRFVKELGCIQYFKTKDNCPGDWRLDMPVCLVVAGQHRANGQSFHKN